MLSASPGCDTLEITLYGGAIDDQSLTYHLNARKKCCVKRWPIVWSAGAQTAESALSGDFARAGCAYAGDAAVTGSAFHAVAPVSAVLWLSRAVERIPAKHTRKPDVAPTCGSAANTKKEIKMSTEFCEEFPVEQNGAAVQTLKDLLEACPEDRFHFMTPFGYADLNAQDAGSAPAGAAGTGTYRRKWMGNTSSGRKTAAAGAGVSVRKAENGQ